MNFLKRTYLVKVTCNNCGMPSEIKVKRGSPVSELVNDRPHCPNCGCQMILKEYKTKWLD